MIMIQVLIQNLNLRMHIQKGKLKIMHEDSFEKKKKKRVSAQKKFSKCNTARNFISG